LARVIAKEQPLVAAVENVPITRVAAALLVLALAGLAFQVALTRVFSLIFQYHFVFLVVSLAILGLGIGAAVGYFALQMRLTQSGDRALNGSILVLAISFPLVAWVLSQVNSSDLTTFAILLSLIPFVLLGWVNALVYARYSSQSSLIYGADLIGAALGPVVALLLLPLLGPFGVMIALGALVALAALMLAGQAIVFRISAVIFAVLIALTAANRAVNFIEYHPERVTNAPPDKTMINVLNNPIMGAEILATRWGPFAQVDVVSTNDQEARFVFTDAGAGSIMLQYDPQAEAQNFGWLDREAAFLPFQIGPVNDTLIIGAGAGFDVFMAKQAGAQSITAVEINPTMVDVTRAMSDYNGGILDLPGVTTVVTDGRNFVDRSDQKFELIYMNVVYSQAAAPGTASLVENHVFTVEALRSYWRQITDDGRIGFVAHNGLEGVRLLMTALRALQDESLTLQEALSRTALVMTANPDDPTRAPSIVIIKRQPWAAGEAEIFSLSAASRGMQPMFIPARAEEALRVLVDGTMSFDEYLALTTDYNIFPTTDNQPFFYHLDPGLPEALRTLLVLSAMLTVGYLIFASALQPQKPRHEWTRMNLVVYFALLGAGFLMVEIALLQRFGLLLGDPVLTLAVTLGALLLGGGLGSLFSRRYINAQLPRLITLAAVGVGIWTLISIFAYPMLIGAVLPAVLIIRIVATILMLLPLGFLMGIPFPGGLRLAGEADPRGIALFWGMNAVASTLGAALATALALLAGFNAAVIVGALAYLLVAALVRLTWGRVVLS
jgi:predicted membrane-bound spermidine synthase